MLLELGHYALILALLLSVTLGLLPTLGSRRLVDEWQAATRRVAAGQALFMALAWCSLVNAFAQNDFSVRNVAENSNAMLPLAYRVAAAWGSHEGSMLLWLLMQSGWTVALAWASRHEPSEQRARVLSVMGWLAAGFILFVLTSSNPFLRVFPVPAEGRDLNPLLQDPAMVLHPPMLYMGYAGFSVAFAFAINALRDPNADSSWARWARPWTLLAWCFLTLGVALGSWWAYYELGWGGWWFWDPVENAALMPWLLGTALLHALAMADRRSLYRAWAALLAILCFSLSLLGTFLVRSGVLSSVHAFALDPRRGVFILGFLLLAVGGSLALFAKQAPQLRGDRYHAFLSRETLLLVGSVLLLVATASVLLGTFYPLLHDLAGWGKLSVGAPYFDSVFVPLMAPAVFLIGVAVAAPWQSTSHHELWDHTRWALLGSAVLGATLPLALGHWSALVALGLALAVWVALSSLLPLLQQLQNDRHSLARLPMSWWGMTVAHLGIAVFIAGVTLVKGYQTEADWRLAPGDSLTVGAETLRFDGVTNETGPNYQAQRGHFSFVPAQGSAARRLEPEKRVYPSMPQSPLTESAIHSMWTGDIYLALGQAADEAGAWTVRAFYKPFVSWIWAGCALMALGGALAARDRRYRPR